MTSPLSPQIADAGTLETFPDFPPRDDMQNSLHLDDQAHQATLRRHFGSGDAIIVLSEIPVGWTPGQREGHRIPDLMVAFGVDRALAVGQKGYSIRDQRKPPDFVLEIASESTGEEDYTNKRDDYAAFGIPNTGGLTPPAAGITAHHWPATGWWKPPTSPPRSWRWAPTTFMDTATC